MKGQNLVSPSDVGKRVSFQFELPNGYLGEAVGVLEYYDEGAETYMVRRKDDELTRVPARRPLRQGRRLLSAGPADLDAIAPSPSRSRAARDPPRGAGARVRDRKSGAGDLVTEIDRAANAHRRGIVDERPDDAILGEEGTTVRASGVAG